MDRYIKTYGFPENQRMELHDGIYSIASKFAVESAKKFDGMICDAIAKAAKDAGVTKLAILDAKGIVEAFKRLAAYEDAEAEGRLVVLPCKVGDRVYVDPDTWFYSGVCYENCFIHSKHFFVGEIVSVIKTKKQLLIKIRVSNSIHSRYRHKRYSSGAIGKTVFLTREEAEEALRRKNDERT